MSGIACYHLPWKTFTIRLRQAWHAIIALALHAWSGNVGLGIPAYPLGSTHVQMTSNVACHYRPWTTYTVRYSRAWHVIIALKHNT